MQFKRLSPNFDLLRQMLHIERQSFPDPWTEQMFADELQYYDYFGAFDGERLVGYIGFSYVLDEGEIRNIAVDPEFRRVSIATQLLEIAEHLARSQSVSAISLEVRESNIAAIALYKRCGYEVLGIRPNYYRAPSENAVIMKLEVRC